MLFLKSWLEDYIDLTGIDNKELADLICLKSNEVEEIKIIDDYYYNMVRVGVIKNVKKVPESDNLNYFNVNIGNSEVQIVSAAKNVRDGLIVPVALIGANYGGFVVTSKKMKGFESQGVCLGKSELNQETIFSEGLWELNDIVDHSDIGKSICEVMPTLFPKDVLFEIKVLPDKIAKIGNHLSMAIEIAIVTNRFSQLKSYAISLTNENEFKKLQEKILNLSVEESNNTLSFEDKYNYSSSFAFFNIELENDFILNHKKRMRMFLIGENLTDTLADISNYIQLDIGQPSHLFDIGALTNDKVELIKIDETTKFEGLGQLKDAQLPKETFILKQDNNILSIPAISGSRLTGVSKNSKNLILEIASFDHKLVSENSFKLNYRSSAAKLYCSDVPKFNVLLALLRYVEEFKDSKITAKILNFSNSQVKFKEYINSFINKTNKSIDIDIKYINSRICKKDVQTEIKSKLNSIGFVKDHQLVPFPTVSLINYKDDIVREITRLIGYEHLDNEYLLGNSQKFTSDHYYNIIKLKELITQYGFYEIATRPFLHNKHLHLIDENKNLLKLINPYRDNIEILRPDLNISVLESLNQNLLDGYKDSKIFEIASTYYQKGDDLIEENFVSGGVIGEEFNIVTSLINHLLVKFNVNNYLSSKEETKLGYTTFYNVNEANIAYITQVSNKVKKLFGLPLNKTIILFSINLPKELKEFNNYEVYEDESIFPSIRRSYNLNLENHTSTLSILNEINSIKVDYKVLVYPQEQLYIDNSKSKLLLNVRYVSTQNTLSMEDIEPIEKILNKYV
jgi:phenylalanyl-tRNA synthetase beta chain